jgi:type II secretory pathway component PulK
MLIRILLTLAVMTTCAVAFHDNTYAVFELREQLLRLTLNLWELLDQLRYASEPLRQRVYLDIAHIQSEIANTIAELMRLDSLEHPASE